MKTTGHGSESVANAAVPSTNSSRDVPQTAGAIGSLPLAAGRGADTPSVRTLPPEAVRHTASYIWLESLTMFRDGTGMYTHYTFKLKIWH